MMLTIWYGSLFSVGALVVRESDETSTNEPLLNTCCCLLWGVSFVWRVRPERFCEMVGNGVESCPVIHPQFEF